MLLFLSPPSPLLFGATITDDPVPVCLFEAGEYPDKGVTITPDDLDQVVARFAGGHHTVVVNTEHHDGPLDPLGEVVALFHKGGRLYGAIAFSVGIRQHIRAREAGKFSVAFQAHEDGGYVLDHVAVTATPRVPGTGFLTGGQVQFRGEAVSIDEAVARFSHEGKLTPAMIGPASRLLSAAGTVNFADGSCGSAAADMITFLDVMPVVQPRGGVIPSQFSHPGAGAGTDPRDTAERVDPEIVAMAMRLGLNPKELAARIVAMD